MPLILDKYGKTPLDYALDIPGKYGKTPLDYALGLDGKIYKNLFEEEDEEEKKTNKVHALHKAFNWLFGYDIETEAGSASLAGLLFASI